MDTQTRGIYLTLIASLVFLTLLLVLFIVSILKHMRHRLEEFRNQVAREIELIDRERDRINIDLHDELGSGLASIGLLLQQVNAVPNDIALQKAEKHLQTQQQKIKEISHGLVPRILELRGLAVALTDLFDEIKSACKIRLNITMQIDDSNFQPAKSVHLFRIIREILTNTMKHAGAGEIFFSCVQDDKKILLLIRDNGSGFDTNQLHKPTQSLGLQNIKSRIGLLNASLALDSKPGLGTKYQIKIPLSSMVAKDGKQS